MPTIWTQLCFTSAISHTSFTSHHWKLKSWAVVLLSHDSGGAHITKIVRWVRNDSPQAIVWKSMSDRRAISNLERNQDSPDVVLLASFPVWVWSVEIYMLVLERSLFIFTLSAALFPQVKPRSSTAHHWKAPQEKLQVCRLGSRHISG